MRVDIITSMEAFATVEPSWDQALQRYDAATIHLSSDWLRSWWEVFGAGREMLFLVARDGDRLIGMAPLLIEARAGLPVLTLATNDLSPRSDIVLLERPGDVMAAFMRTVLEYRWVYVDAGRLPEGSSAVAALHSLPGPGLRAVRHRETYPIPCVGFTESWERFLAGKSQNFRRSLKRAAEKRDALDVRRFPDEVSSLDQALADMRSVSAATWKQRAGTALAAVPEYWAFYERLIRRAHASKSLLILLAYRAGEPVAFKLFMAYRGVLYGLKTGYRHTDGEAGPGFQLMAEAAKYGFGRRTWQYMDMDCATAHSEWKYRWATEIRHVSAHYGFRAGVVSRLVECGYLCKRTLRRRRATEAVCRP